MPTASGVLHFDNATYRPCCAVLSQVAGNKDRGSVASGSYPRADGGLVLQDVSDGVTKSGEGGERNQTPNPRIWPRTSQTLDKGQAKTGRHAKPPPNAAGRFPSSTARAGESFAPMHQMRAVGGRQPRSQGGKRPRLSCQPSNRLNFLGELPNIVPDTIDLARALAAASTGRGFPSCQVVRGAQGQSLCQAAVAAGVDPNADRLIVGIP